MMLVAAGAGIGVLVAIARSARAAPARRMSSSNAELSDGNWAHVEGDLEGGRYVSCRDGDQLTIPDSECALVLEEWPEVDVPITARVRMTAGRLL